MLNDGSKESTEASAAELALLGAGFTYEETGGGCDAYILRDKSIGEIVVTYRDSADAPESMDDPVTVGFYGFQHSEPLTQIHFPTLSAFIASLGA